MAVTVVERPEETNSAYNPNVWVLNSNNKTNDGFRYVVRIINSETNKIVHTLSVAPRPVDSLGEFDLSKFLQTQVDIDIDFASLKDNAFYNSTKFSFPYKIQLGEEHFSSWKFNDTEFVSGGLTKAVGLTNHNFQIGDVVEVAPDDKSLFPQFSGVLSVVDVPDLKSVVFDVPFRTTPTNGGEMKYADNRKIRVWDDVMVQVHRVFKSAVPFNKWTRTYFNDTHILGSVDKKISTTFRGGFSITPYQDLYFMINMLVLDPAEKISLMYRKNDGTILSRPYTSSEYSNGAVYVNATFRGFNLFTNDLKYYDFWIEMDGMKMCEEIRINIIDRCSPNTISLLFEDRMGSLQSLPFEGFRSSSVNAERETYNKSAIDTTGGYDTSMARGATNININHDEIITLNSFPISREQDAIFDELITSYNVWANIDGKYYPCIVATNSLTFRDVKASGLRTRSIDIRLANKDAING